MSRIGKNPVAIPSGVEVSLNGRELAVKGKMGSLQWMVPFEIDTKVEDNHIVFTPKKDDKDAFALWGLSRALTANMVQGVSEGFEKKLSLQGVGYHAAVQGRKLTLSVGYSNPKEKEIPQGLDVQVNDSTEIVVKGPDKQRVGQFSAEVRRVRPPEPYKGKGIRYSDEHVVMKEGKKK